MTYLKAMDRKIWAFALVGVAVVLRFAGTVVEDAHVVLSGVSNIPVRSGAAEETLRGRALDDRSIEDAARAAFATAAPLRQNGYKLTLGVNLLRRALENLKQD